jgi:hypothetical protein
MPIKERSLTYRSWEAMKARCDNPHNNRYAAYGAKGITYPPEWKLFSHFLADMGERPFGMSLERKDGTKSYSKENCCWADAETQNRNRGIPKNSSSGVKGVSWQKSTAKWYASSKLNGVSYNLYLGSDFFAAVAARKSWENKHYY